MYEARKKIDNTLDRMKFKLYLFKKILIWKIKQKRVKTDNKKN